MMCHLHARFKELNNLYILSVCRSLQLAMMAKYSLHIVQFIAFRQKRWPLYMHDVVHTTLK